MQKKHLVVIGGGAAGFFTAINAAQNCPELKVTIVEKTGKLLSKVRVSGGGRCNVCHNCDDIVEMAKCYPRGQHFVRKAFHHFFTNNTVEWFRLRGVKIVTEADGRMFPSTNNSETIIKCFLKEAEAHRVEICLNTSVNNISYSTAEDRFTLHLDKGQLQADFVCVASGGSAKSDHYQFLRALGHSIVPLLPSLFTFNIPGNDITGLMGLSVPKATVKVIGTKLHNEGPLLITHWGLSGPAVLKLSAWGAEMLAAKQYHFSILVNWLPQYTDVALKEQWQEWRITLGVQLIYNKNPVGLPQRLWQHFLSKAGIGNHLRWADVNAKNQQKMIQLLVASVFEVKGKTTFKEEFVTCGGVELKEIDVNTMQSKIQKGLFFAGEVMNVDGITGGYNFQHAWTSGFLAAQGVKNSIG